MMLTCIILEDELPAQQILLNYIAKIPNLEILRTFNNATDTNRYLNYHTVDIVFLDINLPDFSGIDFIKSVKHPPEIIITSAYPEYAVESFELDTIKDYLVKPFSFDRFLKAFHKVKSSFQMRNATSTTGECFYINVDKTIHKIAVNDIIYIESDRNYITLVMQKRKLAYIDTLKNWIEKLPANQFIQVHKSFIINRDYVDKIKGNELVLHGINIPIGRTFKQHLYQQLKIV